MRGPVEQLGCARRPVKAEVAGSNPVGTARTGTSCLLSPGQVAQSVERAAENLKVGGSIPSLPTTSGQVSGRSDRLPPFGDPPIEASLSHRLHRLGGKFWSWGIEPAQPRLLGQALQART
jgi:hypothetical protein